MKFWTGFLLGIAMFWGLIAVGFGVYYLIKMLGDAFGMYGSLLILLTVVFGFAGGLAARDTASGFHPR